MPQGKKPLILNVLEILKKHSDADHRLSVTDIVGILKKEGIKIIIQTVPPFDYPQGIIEIWNGVNSYIEKSLSKFCDGFFDNRPVLSKSIEESHKTLYGGHPNNEGGKKWGKTLYEYVKTLEL